MAPSIRVLVVDDSPYLRKMLSHMLSQSGRIEVVGSARDGQEALDLVQELKPDVVTMDLNMPRLNGVEFLRLQMAREPIAVVVVSIASVDGKLASEAIALGAVELVRKPTSLASEKVLEIQQELIGKVEAAARIPRERLRVRGTSVAPLSVRGRASHLEAIVLGLSTGGPQALRFLLAHLPSDFPLPIAAVLHMPIGYTGPFADKLDQTYPLEVKEASQGLQMRPGRLILAEAGRHLRLVRGREGVQCNLELEPLEALHRPSVDVLFQSAAELYGHRLLAVVLTGMGEDGKLGCGFVKAHGGTVLAEDESTCVVYGMPRSVIEAGLADGTCPLHELPDALLSRV